MLCRSGLFRIAAALVPVAVTGCPQLLSDDYYVQLPGEDPSGLSQGEPDASVEPMGAGGGGSGGSSAVSIGGGGNAGDPGDAGTGDPSRTEIQVALAAALAHRYRFDADTPLLDSVGTANAVSVGATFSDGAAVLAGTGAGQYIDLPNGLLEGLRNASFEVWLIWDESDPTAAAAEWQRIFDLGRNPTTVEGQQCAIDVDATALFLTPRADNGQLVMSCESCTGTRVSGIGLATGVRVQLVAVVDDDGNLQSLYRNGVLVASAPYAGSLSTITTCTGRPAPCDWNNWLGRSQHIEDPPFVGRILDFRVYSAALGGDMIQASFTAGPDADW